MWLRNVFLRMDHSSPLLLWWMGTQWRRMWMWKWTAACGSSFFSAAVVDSVTDSVTDAVMDADVETAVATADAAASYETQILFVQTDQRRGKLYPRLFLCFIFALLLLLFVFLFLLPFPFSFANILHPLHRSAFPSIIIRLLI